MTKKTVLVLLGPTSTGKTKTALKMCQELGGVIISADSRQVVKYMDIGTGKLPIHAHYNIEKYPNNEKWLVNGIDIYGYDLADPLSYFSAYDYALFAREKLAKLLSLDKNIVIVGGTGFYIDVLTGRRTVANVLPDEQLRATLEEFTLEELQKELLKINPDLYERIDQKNKVRLIRAIEISKSEHVASALPHYADVEFKYLGLTSSRENLYSRADAWLDQIWAGGLIDEVKSLLGSPNAASPKLQGLVYKSVVAFLSGDLTEEKAKERAKFDLHAYIRRQQTWFKLNDQVTWFDIADPAFDKNISLEFKAWIS